VIYYTYELEVIHTNESARSDQIYVTYLINIDESLTLPHLINNVNQTYIIKERIIFWANQEIKIQRKRKDARCQMCGSGCMSYTEHIH
jgi:hypothetical protein